jgi:hypothetical protein
MDAGRTFCPGIGVTVLASTCSCASSRLTVWRFDTSAGTK